LAKWPAVLGQVLQFQLPYCIHRIIFYEELPEVKIVSKITLHEKAFLQVFALKFFVKYFPYKFFRINGPPP
jgi:hypothetical protein